MKTKKEKQEETKYLLFRIEDFTGTFNEETYPDTDRYSEINVKIILEEEDCYNQRVIGEMEAVLFYAGCNGYEIFAALDNHSFAYRTLCCAVKDYKLPDKWELSDYDKFIAIGEIRIDEEYRGLGITRRLISWLDELFCVPMLLLAHPLQYSVPNPPKKGIRQATKKVVEAYLKCGFERTKPKSNLLYKMPNL